jgi:hypothetical protein
VVRPGAAAGAREADAGGLGHGTGARLSPHPPRQRLRRFAGGEKRAVGAAVVPDRSSFVPAWGRGQEIINRPSATRSGGATRAAALPPYSPNYNPTEGAWKETKKRTTHNRFFRTTDERDAALVATFEAFKSDPALLAGHVARFI